jgi:hypothetical protein
MKKAKEKAKEKPKQKSSPEQLSPEEVLQRMNSFSARKEKFVAAIKKSQD